MNITPSSPRFSEVLSLAVLVVFLALLVFCYFLFFARTGFVAPSFVAGAAMISGALMRSSFDRTVDGEWWKRAGWLLMILGLLNWGKEVGIEEMKLEQKKQLVQELELRAS